MLGVRLKEKCRRWGRCWGRLNVNAHGTPWRDRQSYVGCIRIDDGCVRSVRCVYRWYRRRFRHGGRSRDFADLLSVLERAYNRAVRGGLGHRARGLRRGDVREILG